MLEKLIPVFALAIIIVIYLLGNGTLAIVFGLTIIVAYAGMSFLGRAGKKNDPRNDPKDDKDEN